MVLRSGPTKQTVKSTVFCITCWHITLVGALLHQANVCTLAISDTENLPATNVHNETRHSLHAQSHHGLGYTV